MAEKHIFFNGLKFTRDEKTGYYLNSTIRKRLHRYVWEFYNGEIPDGYHIHHIDRDKSNNDISNLEMIEQHEHEKLHGSMLTEEERERYRNNLSEKARPKASEWHKSEVGKEWHKRHYETVSKEVLHSMYDFKCQNCGKEFSGEHGSKFCSNKCKSAYRRKIGIDNVGRICAYCGNEFETNKYSNTKTCSRSCANRYRAVIKHESKAS